MPFTVYNTNKPFVHAYYVLSHQIQHGMVRYGAFITTFTPESGNVLWHTFMVWPTLGSNKDAVHSSLYTDRRITQYDCHRFNKFQYKLQPARS